MKKELISSLDCRILIRKAQQTIRNIEDCKQLARSSGSVPANYIEANESLGKKDFLMHIKICRKEAKESALWLKLLEIDNINIDQDRKKLGQESIELMKIFGAILRNST